MATRLVITGSLDRYFELMNERPDLFDRIPVDAPVHLVTDKDVLRSEQEKARKRARKMGVPAHYFTLGVVFEDEWYYGIRDLCEFYDGIRVPVSRKENKISMNLEKIIVIPYCDRRIFITWNYDPKMEKHGWATPRGPGDPVLDAETNARSELLEQAGLAATTVVPIYHGMRSGRTVMLARVVEGYHVPLKKERSIEEGRWVTLTQLQRMITFEEVTDPALVAAYMYLRRFDFPE